MNDKMDLSSEAPNHGLPHSCITNSLVLDENSINSFSSQRAVSVKVTGKKVSCHNCMSPTSVQAYKKFPIPIQTLSRIKNQNSQVKNFLLKKIPKHSSPKVKKYLKSEESYDKTRDEIFRPNCLPKYFVRENSPKGSLKVFTTKITKVYKKTSKAPRPKKIKDKKEENHLIEQKYPVTIKRTDLEFLKIIKTDIKKISKPYKFYKNCESSEIIQTKRNSDALIKLNNKEKKKKTLKKKIKKTKNIFQDKIKLNLETLKKAQSKDDLLSKFYKPINKSNNLKKMLIDFSSASEKELLNSRSISASNPELLKKEPVLKNSKEPQKSNEIANTIKFHENQLDCLKKLRLEEIDEIKNIIENKNENFNIIETITKIIDTRYENIAKIMQCQSENVILNPQFFVNKNPNRLRYYEYELSPKNSSSTNRHVNYYKKLDLKTREYPENTFKPQNSATESNTLHESNQNNIKDLEQVKGLDTIEVCDATEPLLLAKSIDKSDIQADKIKISSEILQELSEVVLTEVFNDEVANCIDSFSSNTQPYTKKFEYFITLALDFIETKYEKIESLIKKPLRKNPLEILAKMQSPYVANPLKWEVSGFPLIISTEIFNQFIDSICIKGHNVIKTQLKMLFDAFNEILQEFRPHGTRGVNMPWSKAPKLIIFPLSHRSNILKQLKTKIFALNSICAGKIPDNLCAVSQENFQNHREEKIGVLMAQDIKKNEPDWKNCEYEETQLNILMADKVLELLVIESISILEL
jgi:hypothetical protein